MIVRVLNRKRDSDKLFDCVRSEVVEEKLDVEEGQPNSQHILIVEFEDGGDCTFVLNKGDEIYYMNNAGRTIQRDLRFRNK